jgi:two-component system sensor kinase FixL
LSTILESTTDAIFINDAEGHYVLANSADGRALGRTVEEMIGQHLTVVFQPTMAKLLLEENRQVMASGRSQTFEHQLTVAGDTRFYSVTKAPYWNDNGQIQGVIGVAHDITERRLSEVQARQQQHTLAHIARLSLAGEMASSLAHELNQPLSAIGIYAETAGAITAKVDLPSLTLTEEQATNLLSLIEKIATQSQRAGEIIHRMKHFTRKTDPLRKAEDINKLIKGAADLIEFMIQQQQVNLHLHLTDELPLTLVDAIQIQQVILNLMYNAIEAMQNVAIDERELCIHTLRIGNNKIEVRVCDSGPNLSSAAQAKLFQPFFTTKPTGTGLGLSISKSIIEAHCGQLWATPQAVRGIMFCFTLPIVKQDIQ